MKKLIVVIAVITAIYACKSGKSSGGGSYGNTRTIKVSLLDEDTYKLTAPARDKSYGYEQTNPVKVGGVNGGPKNERRFLNALLGPNGETIRYKRTGSCCPFKTPKGLIDNSGLLDRYKIYWDGGKDTLVLYFNMYDEGDLFIPQGLSAKK